VYAQVVLLHEAGWPNHDIWLQWQAAHEPGRVTLFTHVKVRLSSWAAQRGWQGLYCSSKAFLACVLPKLYIHGACGDMSPYAMHQSGLLMADAQTPA